MRTDRTRVIPAHVVPEGVAHYTGYSCDKCGRQVSREDNGDGYAHELLIALDQDNCVSFCRLRD